MPIKTYMTVGLAAAAAATACFAAVILIRRLPGGGEARRRRRPPVANSTAECGAPDRASILLDECFCRAGWKGERCEKRTPPVPPCGPYDDRCFFHPDYGVARVSEERWRGAQSHEKATWAEQRTSDRNDAHAANFENYSSVVLEERRGEDDDDDDDGFDSGDDVFGDVIEFGAGPFTQSLTVFERTKRSPRSITLLEPNAGN